MSGTSGQISGATEEIVLAHLRSLQRAQGLSLRELGRRAGMNKSTVGEVLNGDHGLDLGVLLHLMRGFGLETLDEVVSPQGAVALEYAEFGADAFRRRATMVT